MVYWRLDLDIPLVYAYIINICIPQIEGYMKMKEYLTDDQFWQHFSSEVRGARRIQ